MPAENIFLRFETTHLRLGGFFCDNIITNEHKNVL